MKEFKFVYMCNALLRIIVFICITWAAIYFNKITILWFYLIPAFMEVNYKSDEDEDNNT